MKKFWTTVLLSLVVVGGLWGLMNQDRIEQAGGLKAFIADRLPDAGSSSLFRNASMTRESDPTADRTTTDRSGLPMQHRIRVASFKLSGSRTPIDADLEIRVVADICRQFDLVAFQEVDGHRPGWLDELTREIANQSQGNAVYRYASDHVRVARNDPQYALVYNSMTLELEMGHTYTVADPDNVLVREPLVGWFRTRTVEPDRAFTFTVANIQLDANHPGNELAYLGNLYDAIRRDGRGEDDVLIVGDFNAGDRGLKNARQRFGMTWAVSSQPTNTMNNAQFDNIVFNEMATLEFTGNGGVMDFMKTYRLGFRDAMAISEHMPVWAEFSTTEYFR